MRTKAQHYVNLKMIAYLKEMKYAANNEFRIFCDFAKYVITGNYIPKTYHGLYTGYSTNEILDSLHLLFIVSCWWEVVVQVVDTKIHSVFVLLIHVLRQKSYKHIIVMNLFK